MGGDVFMCSTQTALVVIIENDVEHVACDWFAEFASLSGLPNLNASVPCAMPRADLDNLFQKVIDLERRKVILCGASLEGVITQISLRG